MFVLFPRLSYYDTAANYDRTEFWLHTIYMMR